MKNKILCQCHIMWYENKLIPEFFNSIRHAIDVYDKVDIDFHFILNSQTYWEKPIVGESSDMFVEFLSHPFLKRNNITIEYKTDNDPLYNVGDCRRNIYRNDYKYTVWLETDSLLPNDFFYILDNINIEDKHSLTFSSRKMWDCTWNHVEAIDLRNRKLDEVESYLRNDVQINQKQLDEFNSRHDIVIEKLPQGMQKIDGSTVCISGGFDTPFVADIRCFGEDTSFEYYLKIKEIPQYLVSTRLKGHNYIHSLKRCNTNAKRTDDVILQYKKEAHKGIQSFIQKLLIEKSSLTK